MNSLDMYFTGNKKIKVPRKAAQTFNAMYVSWNRELQERCLGLFKWGNTDPIPRHEMEMITGFNGMGFVTTASGGLCVFNAEYSGKPTEYFDMYKFVSVYSPLYSAILDVDKDGVLIKNNDTCTSFLPLCHKYAVMLAHLDVSLVNTLINGRDSGGIPIASTTAQKVAIEEYRNHLCNGTVGAILDPAFSGVEFIGIDKNTTLNIKDIQEVRQNMLRSFYNDIGVRVANEKKGNMTTQEVTASDNMLLFNIDNMYECRLEACDKINEKYGTHFTVEKSPEIRRLERGDDVYGNA